MKEQRTEKDKRPTQCTRVVQYIKEFGSITQIEALEDLGIMRLASRISEINKSKEYKIIRKDVSATNRWGEPITYGRYFFAPIQENNMGNKVTLKYENNPILSDSFKGNQYIEELTILDGFKEIPENAFCDCPNLKKVEIQGESVKKICGYVFSWCKNLVDVKLNEGLEEIDDRAFAYCEKLPRIEIPKSVKKIGIKAFYRCENLQTIDIDNTETFVKTNWDTNWLGNCKANIIYTK